MARPEFVPYDDRYHPDTGADEAARRFFEIARRRRSVRSFSDRPVDIETLRWVVRAAGSAPSGANRQPWRFVCVRDPDLKRRIREGAEAEEREFYRRRAGEEWLKDLEPLGTDENKSFLEVAPWLVVMFKLTRNDDGGAVYYINESAGIAAGFFLLAAHFAGLSTLTHTPSPMGFLNDILGRPKTERPFLLIPVGYAADDCKVPRIARARKPLDEIMVVR